MDFRELGRTRLGAPLTEGMRRLNARHPWSHNDAFHPWILTRLPERRGLAVDVGCGRGELLAALSPHFERVHGIDVDEPMRLAASARCAGLPNAVVDATPLAELQTARADLVTMVAVLHHLDLANALAQVRRVLAPGGRFLCVGLARPESATDKAWDLASMATNPLIGMVRHPWPAAQEPDLAPSPVADPVLSFDEIKTVVDELLPGAVMRHRLAFRYTLEWTA